MIAWIGLAAASWLVGVERGAVDLDADADGFVDGSDVPFTCYRSSRVCVVRGDVPGLLGRSGIRYVERDRPVQQLQGTTLTPCPAASAADEMGYELERIGVFGAWEVSRGAGVAMAVQDAGFLPTHVELDGQILRGWDYGDDDASPEVSPAVVPEHGTFVAGVMVALDDGFGRVGVAPEAGLFAQKIADSQGALYYSYAIAAMDDLVQTAPQVKVLDYSIAGTEPPQAFRDAVEGLGAGDVLLVTAAANCGVPSCVEADNDAFPVYPANYGERMDHVVSVASQRPDGSLDPYSHYGVGSVALAAPGADVCSLDVSSDTAFVRASGTSYAAPVVAGVAGLVRGAFPRLTAAQTLEHLCATALDELTDRVRCGSVDAGAALTAAWPAIQAPASVQLEVGRPVEVSIDVDDLAGTEEVVVSVSGDVESATWTQSLVADASTTLVLPLVATRSGAVDVELTVSGCCHADNLAFGATATEPEASEPTGGTVPSTTSDTGATGVTPAAATPAGPMPEAGCGCGTPSRRLAPWWSGRR